LLPPEGKRSYYHYNGSLTTPPCSENVLWTVMAEPIHFSAAQIKAFTDHYAKNNRPVLKKHRRFVLKFEDKPTDITPAVLIPIPSVPSGGAIVPGGVPKIPRVPHNSTNAPSIGVRGGIGLPGLPLPRNIPGTPTALVANGQARRVRGTMAVAVQPVVKLLNHRVRLAVGAKLVAMLWVALETSLAR
jgi:hypothetical protein